ncbi:MAG: adenosylcobinamide-GDP ribazoletransferase [Nocardiopsaceae bacterium]|nr:adenosylcobinamide-GDP ribazoletransferase [Nocardiopsaceae bacterium]
MRTWHVGRNAWHAARDALGLFSAIPVGDGGGLDEGRAASAVLWLPAVGLLVGGLGGGLVVGVGTGDGAGTGSDFGRRLLGAVLAVALMALLTGGLHLDGLADTVDGLGSRRPAADALEVMRRSDVGPMGVAALVLVLLIQVTALAAVGSAPEAGLALVLAAVTGRVSVVLATAWPAARPGGFGALVAGRVPTRWRVLSVVGLGCAILAASAGLGWADLAVRGLGAAIVGLLAGSVVRMIAVRRLGGTTGDVFGAIVEVTTAAVLVTCALGG